MRQYKAFRWTKRHRSQGVGEPWAHQTTTLLLQTKETKAQRGQEIYPQATQLPTYPISNQIEPFKITSVQLQSFEFKTEVKT